MFPARRLVATIPDRIRIAACLLHAIPGAVGLLEIDSKDSFLVAHHRRDASLTPCQLRHALLEPAMEGVPHLSEFITALEITGGAVDLGGGLFQTGHPCSPEHRWFATTLSPEVVENIAIQAPAELDHHDISARVMVDAEMGVCTIRLSGHNSGLRLDAAAWWLHEQCLVAELLSATS